MKAVNVVREFADFAVTLGEAAGPPSAEVMHHARRALVDWYAAALPGAVQAPATLLETALAEELDCGNATLLLGRKATVRAAALINGTAAHTVEFDDIFRDAIFHPGAPTIAAALAVAQSEGRNGEALLRAVIAGYEISTRIGVAMGRPHYRFWHTTGTVGCFGAAAAAGLLLGLNRQQFAHALATVATFAAGLQQAMRQDTESEAESMSKPLHAGRAAEAGVLAALAARAGVSGSFGAIDGDAGFGHAMGNRALRTTGPDWLTATADLGRVFNITAMTFKNHACCGHTFAAIDGALELKARMQISGNELAHVRVDTYQAALDVADQREAHTAAQAKFSLAYVVAHALIHGRVRLDAFSAARLTDPALRALMHKVETAVDPELDAGFPGRRAARVTVETVDGRSETWLQATRKGDPDAPLSDAELDAKFHELAVPVIGAARAQELLRRLWSTESAANVRLLIQD